MRRKKTTKKVVKKTTKKRKTTTKKVKSVTTKAKSKKVVKRKKTTKPKVVKKKVVLNLTPTEKKLLSQCEEILKDNPKLKSKGLDKMKDLEKRLYYYKVWYYTELNDLTQLRNHKKRCFRGPKCFHLDHVVPIAHCFLEKIPPEKCGHITNLRFIKAKQNIDKGFKLTEESHRVLRRLKRL